MTFADAPCGHLVLDLGNVVLRCNATLLAWGGWGHADVVGKRIDALFGPPSRIFLHTHVFTTVRATGEVGEVQLQLRTVSGDDLPVLLSARRCDERDPVEIEVVVFAVRQRHRFETELVLARRAAEDARLDSEQATAEVVQLRKLESLSALAGGVAHDFNNLLCVILGNTQLLQHKIPAGHAARPLLDDVEAATRRAADLAGRMLSFSGRSRFTFAPLLVADLLASLRDAIPAARRVAWPESGLGAEVHADRDQLVRLIVALVENAAEADPVGPVRLGLAVRDLDAAELAGFHVGGNRTPGPYVSLEVTDQGHGMPPHVRERLFEPFFSTREVGRGMGLATALGITRAHRGEIRVVSAAGLGATVTVILPLRALHVAPTPGVNSRVILIIDPETSVRTLLSRGLARLGHDVVVAAGYDVAVERFQERPDIDCVVLDLAVTAFMGLIRAIRAGRPDVPLIITSAVHDAAAARRVVAPHAVEYLAKPFTVRDVSDVVTRLAPPSAR